MEQLLEILQDIDDSVDYETETKLIDDHKHDPETSGELIQWRYIQICTCWYFCLL